MASLSVLACSASPSSSSTANAADAAASANAAKDAATGDSPAGAADAGNSNAAGADGANSSMGDIASAPDPQPLAGDEVPPAPQCATVVASAAALEQAVASASPGATICIADGSYADFQADLYGQGTELAPIRIAAEHAGGATLTGTQRVGLAGQWLVLQGLRFQGGKSAGANLIETKTKKGGCQHCRVREVTVVDVDAGNATETKWVGLYGDHNRLDHGAFSGKPNVGSVVAVWRTAATADSHLIDHNLFANRAPLGQNGAEAIRVGTGNFADSDSLTVVEQNLFDGMSGEAEIISSKSGGNTFRYNTFRNCAGQLSLRNGSGALVEGNVFLTGGTPDGGGIRVIGANHRVVNNYVEGVRTTNSARGGLVLMAGDASQGAGAYYTPVTGAIIAHNTLYDCQQSLVFGGGTGKVAPVQVTLANNAIAAAYGGSVVASIAGLGSATYLGNVSDGAAPLGTSVASGFSVGDPHFARASDGLMRPGAGSALVGAAAGPPTVAYDLDRQPRTAPFDVGADQVNGMGPTRHALTRADVGPRAYQPVIP